MTHGRHPPNTNPEHPAGLPRSTTRTILHPGHPPRRNTRSPADPPSRPIRRDYQASAMASGSPHYRNQRRQLHASRDFRRGIAQTLGQPNQGGCSALRFGIHNRRRAVRGLEIGDSGSSLASDFRPEPNLVHDLKGYGRAISTIDTGEGVAGNCHRVHQWFSLCASQWLYIGRYIGMQCRAARFLLVCPATTPEQFAKPHRAVVVEVR